MANKKILLRSKIRKGFYVQVITFGMIILGGSAYLGSARMFGIYGRFLALLLLVGGLWALYRLFWVYWVDILVDETGIRFKHRLGRRVKFLPFEAIKQLEAGHFQIENLNGPLTESVPQLTITDIRGKKYEIPANIYENFFELSLLIVKLYNLHNEAKIEQMAKEMLYRKLLELNQK